MTPDKELIYRSEIRKELDAYFGKDNWSQYRFIENMILRLMIWAVEYEGEGK